MKRKDRRDRKTSTRIGRPDDPARPKARRSFKAEIEQKRPPNGVQATTVLPRRSSSWARTARGRGPSLLILAALAGVCYVNADHEEFLFDSIGLTRPRLLSLEQCFEAFWRKPLMPGQQVSHLTFALSHAINEALGLDGTDVSGYLVFNVMVHAINACLVYLLISALSSEVDSGRSSASWIPFAVAAVFAVHPLHASSVAYIVQRRGTLATAFYILAVLAYLRARTPFGGPGRSSHVKRPGQGRDESARAAPDWPWRRVVLAAAVPVCYWFSYRSKPLGLTLPFAILLVEFSLRASDPRALRRYARWMAVGLAVSLVWVFGFLWSRGLFDPSRFQIRPAGPEHLWGPWPHFLTEARAFAHYWKLLLLPLPRWSCIDHHLAPSMHWLDQGAAIAVGFHGLVLLTAVAAAMRRWVLAAVGIFWFYIALIPYVLLPQTELLVEYKTYLPSIGYLLLLSECLLRASRVLRTAYLQVLVAALVAVLLATTVHRNAIYQSKLNLWADAVEKYPTDPVLNHNLAVALADRGDFEAAIEHYRAALRFQPAYYPAHRGLGMVYLDLGLLEEAAREFRAATELHADACEPAIYLNLAGAWLDRGRLDEAIAEYRRAIRAKSDYDKAYYGLGIALAAQGRLPEAIQAYRECLRINPGYVEARVNLGLVLDQSGRLAEAREAFLEALRLSRDRPVSDTNLKARYNLARTLFKLGELEQAAEAYRAVLRLKPDHAGSKAGLEAIKARLDREDATDATSGSSPP